MLHETQRTSAPSSASVSMRTAVWMVMCRLPMIRVFASGLLAAYSRRIDISPGISCSAKFISLRPKSASDRSATLYGTRPAAFAASNACCFFSITVAIPYSPLLPLMALGSHPQRELTLMLALLFELLRQTGRGPSRARRAPAEPLEPFRIRRPPTIERLDLPRSRAIHDPFAD